jgi:hypothetical protein
MDDRKEVPVGTRQLTLGSEQLGWMHDSTHLLSQGDLASQREALQQQLDEDGYLFVRELISPAKVKRGLAKITAALGDAGWFVDGSDPLERQLPADSDTPPKQSKPHDSSSVGPDKKPTPARMNTYDIMHSAEVLDVLEGEELHDFFDMLFGEPSKSFHNKWFRAVKPDGFSGFHMDKVALRAPH